MKIPVTKLDAATRQMAEAIRLFFEQRDPISIHTLIRAALEVLHDLMQAKGLPVIAHKDSPFIKEEARKEWEKALNEAKNFFKHADYDIKAEKLQIDFKTDLNELFLIDCVQSLYILEEFKNFPEFWQKYPETGVFWVWLALKHPNCIIDKNFVDEARKIGVTSDDYDFFIHALKVWKSTPPSVFEIQNNS
jgi:hypothetical protein